MSAAGQRGVEALDALLDHQRRAWIAQRLGWAGLAVAVGIAAWQGLDGPPTANPVLRLACVYFFLLVLMRLAGRRTLGELSGFDFVLLLILSEIVQKAIVREDPSLGHAMLLCSALVLFNVVLSYAKQASPLLERVVEGVPVILLADGRLRSDLMHRARVTEGDILAAARLSHGLERLGQIRFAILETTGGISIVPGAEAAARA